MTALLAARHTQAELLLMGEVVQDELGESTTEGDRTQDEYARYKSTQMSAIGPPTLQRPERIAVAWRVFDVASGQQLGSQTLAINRFDTDREYPDLQFAFPDPRERVIAASARQTWQSVTPYLARENVDIALPWLQPGAAQIRRGNAYARIGRWDMAEAEWTHRGHALSMEQFCQIEPGHRPSSARRLRSRQSDTGHDGATAHAQTSRRDIGLDGPAASLVCPVVGTASA